MRRYFGRFFGHLETRGMKAVRRDPRNRSNSPRPFIWKISPCPRTDALPAAPKCSRELQGKATESIRDVADVKISMYPREPLQVGTARPAST